MRRALVPTLALLGALACGRAPEALPEHVALDLVAALPATGASAPTHTIAATDGGHFLEGWGAVDASREPPVRWVEGSRGVVWFEAGTRPVDQSLGVSFESGRSRRRAGLVLVRLNGRMLGRLPPADGGRVRLPSSLQRPGRNLLMFHVPGGLARRRGLEGARDSFGIRTLSFEPVEAPPPLPEARHDTLVLPAGADATYFLAVPAAGRLVFGVDPPASVVQVAVQADRASERRIAVHGSRGGAVVDLAPEAGRLARLTLTAPAGATLSAPRVVGREPPAAAPAVELPPAPGASVVLYVVDTLRADRLGCYGYPEPTSPHIDAFAREGILFENVVAQSSWTRPATASLLTGLYPDQHGVESLMSALRPDVPTLATALAERGYATAAFVTNPNVTARFGFGRGFERFEYLPEREDRAQVYVPASELNAAAFPWLEAQRDRPFLLYLHASDPHAPYRPAAAERARFVSPRLRPTIGEDTPMRELLRRPALLTPDDVAFLSGLYDGDIAVLDAGFGELVAKLHALGLDRRTLLVLVADHGEEFREHGGLEHGRTLYGEVTRVPLVVRAPGGAHGGRRVPTLVRQTDVLPLVLGALRTAPPAGLPERPSDAALAQTSLGGRSLVGIVTGSWKAVWDESAPGGDAAWLFDLAADPGERQSLAAARPIVLGYARQRLAALRLAMRDGAPPRDEHLVTDPETERRLRALGYLD